MHEEEKRQTQQSALHSDNWNSSNFISKRRSSMLGKSRDHSKSPVSLRIIVFTFIYSLFFLFYFLLLLLLFYFSSYFYYSFFYFYYYIYLLFLLIYHTLKLPVLLISIYPISYEFNLFLFFIRILKLIHFPWNIW